MSKAVLLSEKSSQLYQLFLGVLYSQNTSFMHLFFNGDILSQAVFLSEPLK